MNLFKVLLQQWMIGRGYSPYFAVEALRRHWRNLRIHDGGLFRTLKALRHGVFSMEYANIDLSGDAWRRFLPDTDYMKMHPISGSWNTLIDSKLMLRYSLDPIKSVLPAYYCHMDRGMIYYLQDFPDSLPRVPAAVLDLLDRKDALVLKPNQGARGEGFKLLRSSPRGYTCNNIEMTRIEMLDMLCKLQDHVLTEWIDTHPMIVPFGPGGTIRLIVLNTDGRAAETVFAYLRVGKAGSEHVHDFAMGGEEYLIDYVNGVIYPQCNTSNFNLETGCIPRHQPDNGLSLPEWDVLMQKVVEIGRQIPGIAFAGYDFMLSSKGYRLIEINSHPDIGGQAVMDHPGLAAFFQDRQMQIRLR